MIGIWLLVIFGGAVGVLSTLYLFFGMPAMIIYKLYRKIKYNISMFD